MGKNHASQYANFGSLLDNKCFSILYYPLAIRIYKSYSLFKNIPFIRLNIKVSIGVLFLTTPALLDFQ